MRKLYYSQNKYGYTKKQILIDYDAKKYYVGNLTHFDKGVRLTSKALNEKIEELKYLGFELVIKL